jgi:hypothetical protein
MVQNKILLTVDKIRNDIPKGKHSIAFFCPTKSFRKIFGDLKFHLINNGYHVIHLFGESVSDDFENNTFSYQVNYNILQNLEFVDVFIVPTIMDVLPNKPIKILLLHTGFGGVSFPTERFDDHIDDSKKQPTKLITSYDSLIKKYTHMTAFMPLYDYVTASTPDLINRYRSNLERFNRPLTRESFIKSSYHSSMKDELEHLYSFLPQNKRLASTQCIIPLGYPSFDVGLKIANESNTVRDSITYAPTPCIGKEHWHDYVSTISHGVGIIKHLLEAFPNNRIVFKPYHDERKDFIEPIIQEGRNYKNFILDNSAGDYHKLYSRTSVMVSDFSGTAYTFSLSHTRPTVFFSHNEENLPKVTKESEYTKCRNKIGKIVKSYTELVDQVSIIQKNSKKYLKEIKILREKYIFNAGNSASYLAERLHKIIHRKKDQDWIYFD